MTNPTSYDLVPYDSYPYPQTHPNRLATIATLLGLKSAQVEHCRVLELGCAAGGNLIPMALSLPESRFVGVDMSSVQIEEGVEMIQALGLSNIDLKALSITDVNAEFGRFDYILCHGVYSWVPNGVQDKILDVCVQNLAPNGVAYVSYNTYPGWHMRGMIRDMLSFHANSFVGTQMKVKQARNLLDFLAKAVAAETSPYSLMLRGELESFHRSSDAYLFHEHLEEINEPIYFYQFVERATAKGLKYLGEADLRVMVPGNFPPEISNVLHMLAQDQIHLEQHMDFLRNRMFRQTLLCHKHAKPNYNLNYSQIRRFHLASSARSIKPTPDLTSTDVEQFETLDGLTLNSSEPLIKAAMTSLAAVWPKSLAFDDLLTQAREGMCAPQPADSKEVARDAELLGQSLLNFYASASTSLLELYLSPPHFATTVTQKPMASPLARLQAKSKDRVTTLRHETIMLGEFERFLLCQLNGIADISAIVEAVFGAIDSGALDLEWDGKPVQIHPGWKDLVKPAVEKQLLGFAKSALLAS